jgi:hypothetical protein
MLLVQLSEDWEGMATQAACASSCVSAELQHYWIFDNCIKHPAWQAITASTPVQLSL